MPATSDERSRKSSSSPAESDHLTVEVDVEGGRTVAHVHGEIDMETCERLRAAIEPHLGPRQTLVLDLSGVTFMDSCCLGVFMEARTTLSADGGSLVLRNPSHAARRLLTAARATDLLDAVLD